MRRTMARKLKAMGAYERRHELANALDVSVDTVKDWLKGKRYPQIGNLRKLAAILDTTVEELESDDGVEDEPTEDPEGLVTRDSLARGWDGVVAAAELPTSTHLTATAMLRQSMVLFDITRDHLALVAVFESLDITVEEAILRLTRSTHEGSQP